MFRLFVGCWFPRFPLALKSHWTANIFNNVSSLVKERQYFFCKFHLPFSDKLSAPGIKPINCKETCKNNGNTLANLCPFLKGHMVHGLDSASCLSFDPHNKFKNELPPPSYGNRVGGSYSPVNNMVTFYLHRQPRRPRHCPRLSHSPRHWRPPPARRAGLRRPWRWPPCTFPRPVCGRP